MTGPMGTARIPRDHEFELTGGEACLDFTNTVSDRLDPRPREHLNRYADLVSWGRQAGLLEERQARRLLRRASARPEEARAVLERAVRLREALYRAFSAIAREAAPAVADLDVLNQEVRAALPRLGVRPRDRGFGWDWSEEDALDRMLWPVARSAADLLTSPDLGSVRECASDTCAWLFRDKSRNQSRRWCDMKVCGNRAKARRHYDKVRAEA